MLLPLLLKLINANGDSANVDAYIFFIALFREYQYGNVPILILTLTLILTQILIVILTDAHTRTNTDYDNNDDYDHFHKDIPVKFAGFR